MSPIAGEDVRACRRPAPWSLGGVLLLAVLATACDGGDARPEAAEVADSAGDACGPRVVSHRHGRTEIAGIAERVVSLTARDQDTALGLGVTPTAVRDGFYEEPWAARPWVRKALGDADPEILPAGGELSFERIAALRPDLILARGSGITERDYGLLSRIAPTVAQSGRYADFGAPWQEITRAVGRTLCREERAEERIAELEAALKEARESHPELAGATAAVALPGGPEGSYWVYGPQDSRVRFLTTLGLELPGRIAAVTGDRFAATISAERLDLVDTDVLVWLATSEQEAAIRENPVYRRLEVARDGRDVFLPFDGVLTAAWTNTSALNLPYLIGELVPRIASAVRGAPEEDAERGG